MPVRVYFDANICFDVFEQKPELFAELEELVRAGKVQLIFSEINLTETLKGNHFETFHVGIARLLSLNPTWTFLTGLAARDVEYEYARYCGFTPTDPFVTFDKWEDLLPLISTEEERAATPGLAIPTADALIEFAPHGSIAERLKKKWKPELKGLGKQFPALLKAKGSRWRLFWETTAHTLNRNIRSTKAFAWSLWKNPELAPASRLDLELTYEVLDKANPKWENNDFLDLVHAGAIPYVDLFVTEDGPLIDKLKWYDENVRIPAGLSPYMDSVCTTWDEFVVRIRAL